MITQNPFAEKIKIVFFLNFVFGVIIQNPHKKRIVCMIIQKNYIFSYNVYSKLKDIVMKRRSATADDAVTCRSPVPVIL